MRINRKLIVAEVALIIASVFIFRGLWMLLDMIPFMHGGWALGISLGIGVLVSIPALRYIIRHG